MRANVRLICTVPVHCRGHQAFPFTCFSTPDPLIATATVSESATSTVAIAGNSGFVRDVASSGLWMLELVDALLKVVWHLEAGAKDIDHDTMLPAILVITRSNSESAGGHELRVPASVAIWTRPFSPTFLLSQVRVNGVLERLRRGSITEH